MTIIELDNFKLVVKPKGLDGDGHGDNERIVVYRKNTDKFGNHYFVETTTCLHWSDTFLLLKELLNKTLDKYTPVITK